MVRIGYRSALVVVASAAVLIAAAPPAVSAVDTPPELKSITLSRESITVSGTDVQLLTVSVRFTDDNGVEDIPYMVGDPYPSVDFGNPGVRVYLTLGTGTPRDGVWTGVAPVTSDWDATEQPTRVSAVDTGGNHLSVDPRTVDSHVAHIFQKTGARNRSEVTAYAAATGLIAPPHAGRIR